MLALSKVLLFLMSIVIAVLSISLISENSSQLKEDEAYNIGRNAYVYGYPLVLMEITKQVSTHVSAPQNNQAPINQFANSWKFVDASFKYVVSPNVDTLYSTAWLDLSHEPIVLHLPDTHGRYYLMPMLDAWSNVFASPGKRTTGTKEGNYAIVGPNWRGSLPPEVAVIKAPTNTVWIIGRTQSSGTPEDTKLVNEIQKHYTLTPLSSFGLAYTPPTHVPVDTAVDIKTSPVDQVANMDATTFFNTMAKVMQSNPPPKADASFIEKFAKVGIIPGQEFDLKKLDSVIAQGLGRSTIAGQKFIKYEAHANSKPVDGWIIDRTKDMGNYGNNYLLRAVISMVGLGANLPQDAVYAMTYLDSDKNKLSGDKNYILHFEKGQTPPVNAFWSVTMYNDLQYFVDNPLNRYSINSESKVKYNEDGSLDIYLQATEPQNHSSNWLPAPKDGNFNLILRMYWPKEAVLDGKWKPPVIKRNY